MKKKRNQTLFKVLGSFLLLMSVTVGADAQVTGQSKQGLAFKKVRLWTENNNVVPVCWETDGYDREKDIVREAVTHTWEEFANINFTWGNCPFGGVSGSATAKHVRIRISPQGKDNAGANGSARVGMDALSSAQDNNPALSTANT